MRVLGVDPGLTRCGVGTVDAQSSRQVSLIDVRVLTTPAEADLGVRLMTIHTGLTELIDGLHPDVVAVERVFAQSNTRTAMSTAQAAAMAVLAATQAGLPVVMHTPSEVKAAVTGNGRADKQQVGAMVRRLLRLEAPPRPADAADALALAICHAWRTPLTMRLQGAAT